MTQTNPKTRHTTAPGPLRIPRFPRHLGDTAPEATLHLAKHIENAEWNPATQLKTITTGHPEPEPRRATQAATLHLTKNPKLPTIFAVTNPTHPSDENQSVRSRPGASVRQSGSPAFAEPISAGPEPPLRRSARRAFLKAFAASQHWWRRDQATHRTEAAFFVYGFSKSDRSISESLRKEPSRTLLAISWR